ADFMTSWPRRQAQPGFRLVLAWHNGNAIGLAFGHDLDAKTRWWEGLEASTPDDLTSEYPGRTFAVIELGVLKPYRKHGIGHELHAHLIAGLPNERVTLLVRPEPLLPRAPTNPGDTSTSASSSPSTTPPSTTR